MSKHCPNRKRLGPDTVRCTRAAGHKPPCEEPKDDQRCTLCNHERSVHTDERPPHNKKCSVENCICGRFYLDPPSLKFLESTDG